LRTTLNGQGRRYFGLARAGRPSVDGIGRYPTKPRSTRSRSGSGRRSLRRR